MRSGGDSQVPTDWEVWWLIEEVMVNSQILAARRGRSGPSGNNWEKEVMVKPQTPTEVCHSGHLSPASSSFVNLYFFSLRILDHFDHFLCVNAGSASVNCVHWFCFPSSLTLSHILSFLLLYCTTFTPPPHKDGYFYWKTSTKSGIFHKAYCRDKQPG